MFTICYLLKTASIVYVSILETMFTICYPLKTASIVLCQYIGNYVYNVCYPLKTASIVLCQYIGNNAYNECCLLKIVSVVHISFFGNNVYKMLSTKDSTHRLWQCIESIIYHLLKTVSRVVSLLKTASVCNICYLLNFFFIFWEHDHVKNTTITQQIIEHHTSQSKHTK